MARATVKEISYYEIKSAFGGPSKWRCHVYTTDGDHYSAEAYSKEEAKQNALDAMCANDSN